MYNHLLLMLALIGGLSAFFQVFSWWVRIPVILFLLLSGIILGPIYHIVNPDEIFGNLLFPLISIAVAIILFEGSLTLKLDQIKGQGSIITRLVTKGILITWLGISAITHYFFDINWGVSILFGAIMVVSGPTVITPLVRSIRPNTELAHILRWEGITIDPIGGLLAVLVYGWLESKSTHHAIIHTIGNMFLTFGIGTTLGLVNGFLMTEFLKKRWFPDSLLNICVLNWVVLVYVLSSTIVDETGLLAVTIMGIVVANRKNVPIDFILDFKETLSTLLLSGLFIIMAARMEAQYIQSIFWYSIALFFIIQFIIRPLVVWVCSFGSSLSWRDKAFLSLIAPRGIVAAAMASLFALKLQALGYPKAYLLVPMVFLLIVYSVVLPSLTGRFFGKMLNVLEPDPNGVLIIGANIVAREIAAQLTNKNIPVTLASISWENISLARLAGFNTYYGNPASLHAERNLNLIGIGKILTITPNQDLNSLASIHFRNLMGADSVYYLLTSNEKKVSEKLLVATKHKGVQLFEGDVTYQQLASLLSQKWEIRNTLLTEQFSYQNYLDKNSVKTLPLFAFNPKGKLFVFTDGYKFKPEAGWTVMSFVPKESPQA